MQILPTRNKEGTNDDMDYSNVIPAKHLNTEVYNCSQWQDKEKTVFTAIIIGCYELIPLPFNLIHFIPKF